MSLAEMDAMAAGVLIAAFIGVFAGVLIAWTADWRRSQLRRPGRLETPFILEVPSYDWPALRAATPRGRRRTS